MKHSSEFSKEEHEASEVRAERAGVVGPCTYKVLFVWEGNTYGARFDHEFKTDFVSFLKDLGPEGRRDLESVLRINHGVEFATPPASAKRDDAKEFYWKKRYERLCIDLQEIHERVNEFHPEVEERRVWVLPELIYVSYNYDVVDTEEQAKKNWGENYDVFRHWKSMDGEEPTR